MPLISVIMPAYNAEMYIKEAIESILTQTLTDFEFLIYNDGSTDKTHKIISSFQDDRIVYKEIEKNAGYLPLLNAGLAEAKGKFIARMDADDIALPNRFEVQYKYLEEHTDVGICGSWYQFIGKLNYVQERAEVFEEIQYQLFFGCPLTHPSVMMRGDLIRKHNLKYRQEFYLAEDHYFLAEGSAYFKIVNIPVVLLKYRIHPQQVGSAKWKEQFLVKSKIQARLFSNVLLAKDSKDLKWLELFFMEKSIPAEKWLDEIDYYYQKIIRDNELRPLYPQSILEKAAGKLFKQKTERNFYTYYFNKYYNQYKYSPKLLLSFFAEKYKPYQFLGKKLTFFFLIKCFIWYKKKTILAQ